jgi:hypothetical protein
MAGCVCAAAETSVAALVHEYEQYLSAAVPTPSLLPVRCRTPSAVLSGLAIAVVDHGRGAIGLVIVQMP